MVKRLVAFSAWNLILKGRKIVAKLRFDPRLAEPASEMSAVQDRLESRYDSYDAAEARERMERGKRDEAHRILAGVMREFGFSMLTLTNNHHGVDPYLRFFPDGYGHVTQLKAEDAAAFSQEVLVKLEEQTEPVFVPFREKIQNTRNGFVAAQESYVAAATARKNAFALLQAEKREWARGVARVRALAESACHFDRPYLKSVFAPVSAPHRRNGAGPEVEETPEEAASVAAMTPAAVMAPVPAPRQGSGA